MRSRRRVAVLCVAGLAVAVGFGLRRATASAGSFRRERPAVLYLASPTVACIGLFEFHFLPFALLPLFGDPSPGKPGTANVGFLLALPSSFADGPSRPHAPVFPAVKPLAPIPPVAAPLVPG